MALPKCFAPQRPQTPNKLDALNQEDLRLEVVPISTIYKRQEGIVTRSIAGETILVPVRNRVGDLDSIYTLNEIGSTIWKLLDSPAEIDRIVSAVVGEYDVTTEEAAGDVAEFIARLESAGLISEINA